MKVKVLYESVEFFNRLLEYVQTCSLECVEDRSTSDYITIGVSIVDGHGDVKQELSITKEKGVDCVEILFHRNKKMSDKLYQIQSMSQSYAVLQSIIAVCLERTTSQWLEENDILQLI